MLSRSESKPLEYFTEILGTVHRVKCRGKVEGGLTFVTGELLTVLRERGDDRSCTLPSVSSPQHV